MKRFLPAALSLSMALVCSPAFAHFQEVIPSHDIVSTPAQSNIDLNLFFTHPMEMEPAMNMGQPVQFGVVGPDGKQDLLSTLKPITRQNVKAYETKYQIKKPGDYLFYLEPAPYWEPAEGKMIIHYTKVVVDAYGMADNWDAEVGLPVEIEPLSRPFGLWTGNEFRGVVKHNGKPVPFAEIEVEWVNDGSVTPPSDPYKTQVIKADANGTFSYAMPHSGWWGFAALIDGPKSKNPEGKMVPTELGGLIWVQTRDMK